jgi:hypothetical protein
MKKQSIAGFAVELRRIEEVFPYARNPRHNDSAIAAVASSLRQFGFRKPIVVDAKGVIICGHTTLLAAKQLGLTHVPVHVAKDLTPKQARAYRIADNKTGEIAEWNLELLPIELAELQEGGCDLAELGFGADELAELLSGRELREGWAADKYGDEHGRPKNVVCFLGLSVGDVPKFEQAIAGVAAPGESPVETILRGLDVLRARTRKTD